MNTDMVTISFREFSRRMGVSDTAVHKAVEANKIVKGVVLNKKGKQAIDFEVAKAEWMVHGGPVQAVNRGLTEPIVETPKHAEIEKPVLEKARSVKQLSLRDQIKTGDEKSVAGDDEKLNITFVDANRKKAVYESKIKELELAKLEGTLVNKADVYQKLFKLGQEMRGKFEAIPDRIIDNLLASTSRTDAHNILSTSINEVLKSISEIKEETLLT